MDARIEQVGSRGEELIHGFLWRKDAAEAKKMNRDLEQFRKRHDLAKEDV